MDLILKTTMGMEEMLRGLECALDSRVPGSIPGTICSPEHGWMWAQSPAKKEKINKCGDPVHIGSDFLSMWLSHP